MSISNNKPSSVLVTRPAHQSGNFIKQLEDEGFKVVKLPSIEIEFESHDLTKTLQSDLIIFTSANAVTGANKILQFPWDCKAKIAAIGKATANALEQLNCQVDIVPHTGASSEALLDMLLDTPEQLANLTVTIVRGDSGRNKLFNTLLDRGVKPRYQSVYLRKFPQYSVAQIESVFSDGLPDIISVTSDLGLTNLLAIVPIELHPSLLSRPLVVNSARCAQLAKDKGFSAEILVADSPGDESQLTKILSLR